MMNKTMTNEVAIECLETQKNFVNDFGKEAFDMAIEALQKEMPDKWIIGREDGGLTYTHDTENCLTTVNVHFPYCPYCGKKMKL